MALNKTEAEIEETTQSLHSRNIPLNIKINEITMILAEKRTSLAVLRTGVALFALPLSIMGLLIATSKYWDIYEQWHLFIPIFLICNFLIGLGLFLMIRSMKRIVSYDKLIKIIKNGSEELTKLMENEKSK